MSKNYDELCKSSLKSLFKNCIEIDDFISDLVNLLCSIEEIISYLDNLYDQKEVELKYYRYLKKEFFENE